MLNSVMIDVALGMVFIFLMLSLVCAAVREAIEARLKIRSKFVAYGIAQLLQDPNTARRFYEHPTIQALYGGSLSEKDLRHLSNPPPQGTFKWVPGLFMSLGAKTNLPSYIPARTFALTLLQLASSEGLLAPGNQAGAGGVAGAGAGAAAGAPNTIDLLKEALAQHPNSALAKAMSTALITAGNDIDKAVDGLSAWFDASMDRVSGWYKRETQHILFWVGFIIAVALNVDTLFLIKYLSSNEAARNNIVAVAQKTVEKKELNDQIQELRKTEAAIQASKKPADTTQADKPKTADTKNPDVAKMEADAAQLRKKIEDTDKATNQAIRDLADLNLPIGWNRERWNAFDFMGMGFVWTLLGWLVTAFGLSFGAPFWFDVLNKIMVIRSTVKPHEKSLEEASEDRQRPPPLPAPAAALAPAAASAHSTG